MWKTAFNSELVGRSQPCYDPTSGSVTGATMSYLKELVSRLWNYKAEAFGPDSPYFEEDFPRGMRPPVFTKEAVERNVLVAPDMTEAQRREILRLIPPRKRHLWFRSMTSSQALVQSVFGNLAALNKLSLLADLVTEDGFKPFQPKDGQEGKIDLEFAVDYLGEPRPTEVDVFFRGNCRVAVECKLSESDVGTCSRPRLKSEEPEHCDGTYTFQKGRQVRCALTEIDVKYWDFVPVLFKWDSDVDHSPCPLRDSYQLVRNVLASSVLPDGRVASDEDLAMLLYDERSPTFQLGGKGHAAFEQVRDALLNPLHLQRCTWQDVMACIRIDASLAWLTEQLGLKYWL